MIARIRTYKIKAGLRQRLLLAAFAALVLAIHPGPAHAAEPADASHAFDFEFGDWTMHLKRRLDPLTGSDKWVEYDGSSVVRKVWGGKANLGEIDIAGPAGHIQGLSLRVYNPKTRQWSVSFANAASGELGVPMMGGFRNGRGEFYDQETFNGRAIFVRFIFSDITADTFRLEQAFSNDGGKTWEANWIADFKRTP
jgi:hypothetical protein